LGGDKPQGRNQAILSENFHCHCLIAIDLRWRWIIENEGNNAISASQIAHFAAFTINDHGLTVEGRSDIG
jgi:hypothetical protein